MRNRQTERYFDCIATIVMLTRSLSLTLPYSSDPCTDFQTILVSTSLGPADPHHGCTAKARPTISCSQSSGHHFPVNPCGLCTGIRRHPLIFDASYDRNVDGYRLRIQAMVNNVPCESLIAIQHSVSDPRDIAQKPTALLEPHRPPFMIVSYNNKPPAWYAYSRI